MNFLILNALYLDRDLIKIYETSVVSTKFNENDMQTMKCEFTHHYRRSGGALWGNRNQLELLPVEQPLKDQRWSKSPKIYAGIITSLQLTKQHKSQ